MNKKVAIVVGHAQDSKGACGIDGIPCEWDYNSKVASFLTDIADVYFYDGYQKGYTTMVKKNAEKLNAKNYDLIIELHYNAASPSANGVETLYYFNSEKGKKAAVIFSAMVAVGFGIRNRGIRALVNSQDRGFAAVYYTKAPTILVEPFFGSSKEDVAKFKGQEKKYADLIRQFIKTHI